MTRIVSLLALGLAALAACADNPVTPEEHFEARGVVLAVGDSTVVTVDSNRVTGGVRLDTASTGRVVTVKFITDEGENAVPGHDETELSLDVQVADTTIARVVSVDSHAWSVRLAGRRAGSTTMTVHLLHGGHDDFVSVAIPLVVAP